MRSRLSKILLIAPALLAIIIDYFGWGLVYPLATAIFDDPNSGFLPASTTLPERDFYLSLSFLLYPLSMLFGASSMGDLSDIYGRKKILFICTIGIGVSFLCMGVGVMSGSPILFLLGRAVSGFMAGTVPIAQATIIDISAPEDKPFNLALLAMTFAVGLVLGPLVGSLLSDTKLVHWFSYTTPFFFSALLAFLTAGWIKIQFTHQEILHPTKTFSLLRPFLLFAEAFRNKDLRKLSCVLFFFQCGISLYLQTILIYLNSRLQYTSLGLGLFWVVIGAGFILGLALLKVLIKTPIPVSQLITGSLMAQAMIVILSSMFVRETPLWILGFLMALANPASYALLLAVFSNTTPQESQGWVMGIWTAIVAASFVIGALGNNLIPWLGLDPVIFLGGALVGLSGLLFHRFARR